MNNLSALGGQWADAQGLSDARDRDCSWRRLRRPARPSPFHGMAWGGSMKKPNTVIVHGDYDTAYHHPHQRFQAARSRMHSA